MNSSRETEEIAAAWLARRDGGDWSETEQAAFTEWLQASTAHHVAFLRLEAAWRRTDRLKALGARAQPGVVPSPGEWWLPPVVDATGTESQQLAARCDPPLDEEAARAACNRTWPQLRGIAAAVLIAAVFAAGWYSWPRGSTYHTDVGGLASVPMPDGSHVTLNTKSEIRVAVTETERRVSLEHGEAFFEVVKDPERPFVVYAGDRRVIAVGTKFAVRRETGEIRVVVTEGRVRVEPAKDDADLPVTQLSAGTFALAGHAGTLIQEKRLAEAEDYLSWRRGFLVFRETSLGEAVAEFNRYNTRKIVIDDPAVAAIRIGGSFRSTNVDAFIRLTEQGFPVRAERRDGQIILKAA